MNLATFVGTAVAELPGAIVATMAEVLPAFVIMLIFTLFAKDFFKHKKVQFVLQVIRPCVIGIIMSVGVYMLIENLMLIDLYKSKDNIAVLNDFYKGIIIAILILVILILYRKIAKKSLGTIKIIIIGAIFGVVINYLI